MSAYYNEHDPKAAAWLRELIKQGHIANGEVDERSIVDVDAAELVGFTQCHFFAGIGVWSYALRCAGWPDGRPVWTGSCPCQPFSAAGKQAGTADSRHLWPAWYRLIRECRPECVFGEQVASAIGHGWLDLVSTDLESEGYAVGSVVLGAHSVGAPHIRQRLWFVGELADTESTDRRREQQPRESATHRRTGLTRSGTTDQLGYAEQSGLEGHGRSIEQSIQVGRQGAQGHSAASGVDGGTGQADAFWRTCDWLYCTDGKWRPVEPGTFPLADGTPARVGRLRGYGNAIVAPVAQAFIESYLDGGEYR